MLRLALCFLLSACGARDLPALTPAIGAGLHGGPAWTRSGDTWRHVDTGSIAWRFSGFLELRYQNNNAPTEPLILLRRGDAVSRDATATAAGWQRRVYHLDNATLEIWGSVGDRCKVAIGADSPLP
jgi:hypothetical protein